MSVQAISVIGIGKLGLCMCACFANKGYETIGVDLNADIIKAVNESSSPIFEPGLDALIKASRPRLIATKDYDGAIKKSDMSFIVVPTPSGPEGGFSTKYVEVAAEKLGQALKQKPDFHVIVLTSTVLPGVNETIMKPVLEKASGKRCGVDFGLCYNPEFIALGSVIRDFTSPDVILIGESDPRSGQLLAEVYQRTCENNPPTVRTTFSNAELAKISINSYVTMKISFANFLAEMCEHMPGGDVDIVSKILGLDSRIGRKYLQGGLGFGGPCFPRDNRALSFFADKIGAKAVLPLATDKANQNQTTRVVKFVKNKLGEVKDKSVAVLGLTYKPDTNIVEESASLAIAKALLQEGASVSVYDPAGIVNARQILGDAPRYSSSVLECLKGSEFCIVATPWREFQSLKPADFIENMKKPVLLDCWRIFDRKNFSKGMEYLAIGLNAQ